MRVGGKSSGHLSMNYIYHFLFLFSKNESVVMAVSLSIQLLEAINIFAS